MAATPFDNIPGSGPYLSRDADGNPVYKTFEQVNAAVMATAVPQTDPKKPGFQPYLISGNVQGGAIIEAKERDPTKAFLHIVSWMEFRPFLDELAAAGTKIGDLKTQDQYYPDGSMIDLSWDEVGQNTDELHASILNRILVARKADLRRGDAIRMQFVSYRCYGTYFYDGTKVILPEEENSDYYHVPSTFKVPTEFPMDYWDDCCFLGYSGAGDVCFDVASIASISEAKEVKIVRTAYSWQTKPQTELELVAMVATMECKSGTWHLFISIVDDSDYEERLSTFKDTGLCWDAERLGVELTRPETDEITKGLDPKRIVVI